MVGAAFELYKSDNDLTDLVDTLLRVAGQRFPESAVEEPVEQASEDITSWSELARAVIGHVCADRQFSADEALRLTELIVQRDTSLLGSSNLIVLPSFSLSQFLRLIAFAGVIEVLISQGASWSNLLSALHRFISTLIEREAEQAPLMQHSDSNTYGSVGSRASSRQSIAATDSRSETPLDREVASVLTSPLSLREGMQRLLDMMLRDGTLQSAQLDWLMTLVDQREPVLMAAFQVLLEDGVNSDDAFDEFEDTVLRLVQLRFPASSSVKSTELESPRGRSVIRPDSPPPPDAASRPLTAVDDEAGEVADDGVRLLHDELVFLRILGDEGLLSDEDCVLLQGAVLSGDVVSRAALDLYRETGDMEDLIDTLLRCADQERQRMIQDSIADESDSEVDDQDEDAMNEVDYFSVIFFNSVFLSVVFLLFHVVLFFRPTRNKRQTCLLHWSTSCTLAASCPALHTLCCWRAFRRATFICVSHSVLSCAPTTRSVCVPRLLRMPRPVMNSIPSCTSMRSHTASPPNLRQKRMKFPPSKLSCQTSLNPTRTVKSHQMRPPNEGHLTTPVTMKHECEVYSVVVFTHFLLNIMSTLLSRIIQFVDCDASQ
jgi:hypothetical protein